MTALQNETGLPDPDDARPASVGGNGAVPRDLPEESVVEALPALARVAAGAWLRMAAWSVTTSVRAGGRVARAATDPDAAARLVEDVSSGLRAYAREFLGVTDLDDRVKRLAPAPGVDLAAPAEIVNTAELLRARGTELLAQAADVHFDHEAHPAYGRILTEIVPDEARILRLLATGGPQPIVDVRASNLIGVGSQLIERGLNMIGAGAGLRHRGRVTAYLNNLSRLGLIVFTESAVDDAVAYQVLEAQPEVLQAIRDTTRAKTTHRSVALTPFGLDFCQVCLPLNITGPDTIEGSAHTAEYPALEP